MASLFTARRLCAGLLGSTVLAGPVAMAGTLTALHTFAGSPDGAVPLGGTATTPDGTVYGTTYSGGSDGDGTIYRINPDGTEQLIVTFHGPGANGAGPEGAPIIANNTLYGTTTNSIFSVSLQGRHFQILHTFTGSNAILPRGRLQVDAHGNIYGFTCCGPKTNAGVVYELLPDGTFLVLHTFTSRDAIGIGPSSLLLDPSSGTLFGTTGPTGPDAGVVYALTPSTDAIAVLHAFNAKSDGRYPSLGGIDRDGSLYGAASDGGQPTGKGHGTLFVLRKQASAYRFRVLYAFADTTDGQVPNPPYVAPNGALTGTTNSGGDNGSARGTLYTFQQDTLTTRYVFHDEATGGYPSGTPSRDHTGAFYGISVSKGAEAEDCAGSGAPDPGTGCGVVWKYTP